MGFKPSYNIMDRDTHNALVNAFQTGGIAYTDDDGTVHKIADDYINSGGGSSLPEVTSTDEGKVLAVNASGEWAAENYISLKTLTITNTSSAEWDYDSQNVFGLFSVDGVITPFILGSISTNESANITVVAFSGMETIIKIVALSDWGYEIVSTSGDIICNYDIGTDTAIITLNGNGSITIAANG